MRPSIRGDTGRTNNDAGETVSLAAASTIYRMIVITGKADTLHPACIIYGFKIYTIIDLGAIFNFINYEFLRHHELKGLLKKKPYCETLVLADGHTQSLTHIITLTIIINDYIESMVFTVAHISAAPAVLGMILLELHNPRIN